MPCVSFLLTRTAEARFLAAVERGIAAAERAAVYRGRRDGRPHRAHLPALIRIRWTMPAAEDLESIKSYLQQRYPHFAEPTVRAIYQRIRSLRTAPNKEDPATGAAQEN